MHRSLNRLRKRVKPLRVAINEVKK
jgi:hypothetical protein